MNDRISVVRHDHVAVVTLDRAEKMNAVDRHMFDAFGEVGERLAADRSLRAVVLTGAGDHFCAGIDTSTFSGGAVDAATMQPRAGTPANLYQQAAYVWRNLPVPVIAALKGSVFGAGLQIALGADLRIAAPDTRMSIMETKWGLIPDMALSTTVPALLRYDVAAELVWTGRILSAAQAADLGLLTRVTEEPLEAAMELAATIAERSPDAVCAAKQLLQASYAERDDALLALEAALQTRVMGAKGFVEAVTANLEKRSPDFGDRDVD